MKKNIYKLTACLLFISTFSMAQSFPPFLNPSFEYTPSTVDISLSTSLTALPNWTVTWTNGGDINSSDSYHNPSGPGATHGLRCFGFHVDAGTNFITQRFSSPLKKDTTYAFIIDHHYLGSDGSHTNGPVNMFVGAAPFQLKQNIGSVPWPSNTSWNCKLITFTADSAYQYFTIRCFNPGVKLLQAFDNIRGLGYSLAGLPSGQTACVGQTNTLSVTGNTTNISNVNWTVNGGVITSTIAPYGRTVLWTTPGTYTLRAVVNDVSLCATSLTLTQTFTVSPSPTVAVSSIAPSATLCSGQTVTFTPSGANTYTLTSATYTDAAAPYTDNPLATTSYTIKGTNSSGCVSTTSTQQFTANILVNTTPTVTGSSVSSNTICSGETLTFTPNGASTYTLITTTFTDTSAPYTDSPSATTTYTLLGTSASGGCISSTSSQQFTTTVNVNNTPTLSASSVSSNTICTGETVTFTPSGGASTYTLSSSTYTDISSPYTDTPSITTSYTLTGTGANGCISLLAGQNFTTNITVNTTPTLTGSSVSSNTICSGETVTFTPIGGASTYTLTSLSYTDATAPYTDSPDITTSYTLSGTGANGCVSFLAGQNFTTNITVNTTPTLTGSSASSNTICSGETVTFTPSGGASTYTLTSSSYTDVTTPYTDSPSVNTSYTLSGTGANGCVTFLASQLFTVDISVNTTPTLTGSSVSSNTICSGETLTFTPSGGAVTYTLSSLIYTDNSSPYTDAPLTTTDYTLSGTGANGCIALLSGQQFTTTVNVNVTPILLGSSVSSNSICTGQTVTFTPSGGATSYTLVSSTYTDTTAPYTDVPLVNTTYTLLGTGSNGCVSVLANQQYTASIFITSSPTITLLSQQDVLCFGQAIGSVSISTLGGTGSIIISPTPTNLSAGNYVFTATDVLACVSNTISATINELSTSALVVTEASQNPACIGENNGSVLLIPSGGTPTYTIIWNTNDTTFLIKDLGVGIVTATVTDANGCVFIYNKQIIETSCFDKGFPVMITPNGDGKNEVLFLNGLGGFPNNKLEIYNRWGNLVFSKQPYDNSFKGVANTLTNGNILPSGTYFIIFDFGDGGETKPFHGFLELKY